MNPLVIALAIRITTASASTGYGFGALGALDCPTPFAPAAGAIQVGDDQLNRAGLLNEGRARLRQLLRLLDQHARVIAHARLGLINSLGADVYEAIENHHRFARGPRSYRAGCASPDEPIAPDADGREAPPAVFCVAVDGKVHDRWSEVVGPEGRVSDRLCGWRFGRAPARTPREISSCVNHLRAREQALGRLPELHGRLARLNRELQTYEANAKIFDAREVHRGICLNCLRPGLVIGAATEDDAPAQSVVRRFVRLVKGEPPPASFDGNPLLYPARPYVARVTHYYSTRGGQYGGAPGGIGRGSFAGCPGPVGLGLASRFAAPREGFTNSRALHPYAARYADPRLEPPVRPGLFNTGFGPGGGPWIGRGRRPAGSVERAEVGARPFGFAPPSAEESAPGRPYLWEPGFVTSGLGNPGARLVDRPVFPLTKTADDSRSIHDRESLGVLPSRRFAGGALFAPLRAGPALSPPLPVDALPTSTLSAPAIIR